ncbi:MAG: MAPEG family protein [Alcanivoracaceae bacterium]|nr:MAPEG family protein [Alcanivoracaceae bacterium]
MTPLIETPAPILLPVMALVGWSLVMWLWMYVTRLPAMRKAKMKPDPNAPRGEQMSQLPASVRWKADNYNHLMEQPTIFYAAALALAVMGQGDGINLILAWSYVGLRVVHSLLQSLVNIIELRFALFALSTLPLIAMAWNGLAAML